MITTPPRKPNEEIRSLILSEIHNGLTQKEIVSKLHTSYTTIQKTIADERIREAKNNVILVMDNIDITYDNIISLFVILQQDETLWLKIKKIILGISGKHVVTT